MRSEGGFENQAKTERKSSQHRLSASSTCSRSAGHTHLAKNERRTAWKKSSRVFRGKDDGIEDEKESALDRIRICRGIRGGEEHDLEEGETCLT